MDSEEKMKDLLKEIELSILDYQNNVLQGKYADNLQKLQEKLDSLKKTFDEFLELQKTTKLSWKSNVQFRAAIQYFKILNLLANHYIRKGKDKELAEFTVLKNKYIQNFTMLEVINKQLEFFRQGSITEEEFKKKYPKENISQYFLPVTDLNGEKILIPNKNISNFEKFVRMHHDMEKVLKNNLEQLQEYQNKNVEPEVENLGDFSPSDIGFEKFLFTDQEIRSQIETLRNNIQKLQTNEGKQKVYQFTIGSEHYQYVIPVAKKGEFINIISEMALLSSIIKLRSNQIDHKTMTNVAVDNNILNEMNPNQAKSHLENALLRMESDKRKPQIHVFDYNGNEKVIAACFYRDYQKIVSEIIERTFQIHLEEINNLNQQEQISFYENRIAQIEKLKIPPYVLVNGVEISALLTDYYQHAKESINQLKGVPELIDFDYAETLSEKDQLSYYRNAIGMISRSDLSPKLPCNILGNPISIPLRYLISVQKCEEKIKSLKIKRKFSINEKEVLGYSKEMQFVYYGRLIQKMHLSKDQPKVTVEAFGEKFEIPKEAFDNFQECVKRMNELKNLNKQKEMKKFKVKNIKKSLTDKIKKMPSKIKIAIASTFTVGAVLLSSLAALTSSHQNDLGEKIVTVAEEALNQDFESLTSSFSQSVFSQSVAENYNANNKIHVQSKIVNRENENKNVSKQDEKNDQELIEEQKKIDFCSRFGSVVLPADQAQIFENPFDLTKPLSMKKEFQKTPCTIVKINVRMPNQELFSVPYNTDCAQAYVDELLNNGGILESVGVVSQLSEENYKKYNQETGILTLDQINPIGNNTLLAEEVRETVKEMGVSR